MNLEYELLLVMSSFEEYIRHSQFQRKIFHYQPNPILVVDCYHLYANYGSYATDSWNFHEKNYSDSDETNL